MVICKKKKKEKGIVSVYLCTVVKHLLGKFGTGCPKIIAQDFFQIYTQKRSVPFIHSLFIDEKSS